MRHPDDHFLHAGGARFLDQMIEHRDHRVAALAGKSLLPDVLGMQIALQRLGGGQPLQDVLAKLGRIIRTGPHRLEALLDEALLRRIGHVHVFGAEAAAVGFLQRADQIAQAHAVRASGSPFERADVVLSVEVGLAEAVALDVEVGNVRPFGALERIDIGLEQAQRAELADQPQHQHLFVHGRGIDHAPGQLAMLGELNERLDDRRVRDVGGAIPERVEIGSPVGTDRSGIGKVGFVLLLDKRRVAAKKRAAALELLHRAHGVTCKLGRVSTKPSRTDGSNGSPTAERRAGWRRYRADAAVRSSGPDPRSSRSTGRSSRPSSPARRWP